MRKSMLPSGGDPMTSWHSMQTAPLDGMVVLVTTDDGFLSFAFYLAKDDEWWERDMHYTVRPVAWMHPPEPAQSEALLVSSH
jgi:hypothetical protein